MKSFKLSSLLDYYENFMFSVLTTRSSIVLGFAAYWGTKYGLWTSSQFFIGLSIFFGMLLLPSIIRLLVVLIEWGIFTLFTPNPLKTLQKDLKKMKKFENEFNKKISQLELLQKELETKSQFG